MTEPIEQPPRLRRRHTKVSRFFAKLTRAQLKELAAVVNRQIAITGLAPEPFRTQLIEFVERQP